MTKTTEQFKFYLPQLDGLRFFAFFLVFIHHFLPAEIYFQSNSFLHFLMGKLHSFGWIGVDIFLCLSSFLLTTLLLVEYKKTQTISIKNFFIRRALRIWPLYFFVLVLAFTIFPYFHYFSPAIATPEYTTFVNEHLFPYSVFLGNFSYDYFRSSLTIPIMPLWTISLEEQFYLLWPILLFLLAPRDKKYFFTILLSMILFSLVVRIYIIVNNIPYPTIWVFTFARLDPFALGALLSYLYLNNKMKPRPMIALIFAAILFKLVISSTNIGDKNTIWQLLFVDMGAILLIYTAIHSKILAKMLSAKPLVFLGKISFGLYVFHYMMIAQVTHKTLPHLWPSMHWDKPSGFAWLIAFSISVLGTVIVAVCSYYMLERPFLKLKNRFTAIPSRPLDIENKKSLNLDPDAISKSLILS